MNNKLLKRFLITTALGAASFSGIADVMAVSQAELDLIAVGGNVVLSDLTATNPNTTLNLGTINSKDGVMFGYLDLGNITGVTFNVGATAANDVNGGVFSFTKIINTAGVANAEKLVSFNAVNNAQLSFGDTGNLINKLAGNDKNFKLTFEGESTVAEVTGINTSVIAKGTPAANGANGTFAELKLNKVGAKGAAVKSLEVTGNAASILTVNEDSYAKEYKVAAGILSFNAKSKEQTVEGDATLSNAAAQLNFTNDDPLNGYVTAGKINFHGKITSGAGMASNINVQSINGKGNIDVVILGEIQGYNHVINITGNANAKSTLTLKNKSTADGYNYDANSTLILDSTDFDAKNNAKFTHTGKFIANGNAVLKTQGILDVTIDGTVNGGKLEVGTKNGATTIVTGNLGYNNATAVEFLEKTTLKLTGGTNVATNVNFGGKEGIIEVNGKDATFGKLENINGSTIKVTSDNDLTFAGAFGKTGDLLTVDASKVTKVDNFVQVSANANMFNSIDTGAGQLKAADGATIYAKEIKGGNIFAGKNFTIKAVDKTIKISSTKVEIADAKTLTITAEDFGTFASKIAGAVGNGATSTLVLSGSGTIDLGAASTVAKFSIADANRTVTLNNSKNLSHNIGQLNFGPGRVNLAGNFINTGDLEVEGTLNLDKFTLKNTGIVELAANSTIEINDGAKFIGDIADTDLKTVTLKIAKNALVVGDKDGKMEIANNGAAAMTLIPANAANLKFDKDTNSFALDNIGFIDANNGANVQTIYVTRTLDNVKFKTVLDNNSSPVTGNFKKFTDSLQKEGVDKLKADARSYVIKAGSADSADKSIAHLASALPRNIVETQKNVMIVNQSGLDAINSVVRARAAGAASDDLKTNASIWAKGTYGKGTQEVSDIYSSAYDSSMFGAIVGAEFGLGESLTVGAAGSYTQTTVTYKGLRTDEDKFKSIYGSLYGFANLESNFVLNASMTFGSTKIDGKTVSALTANSSDDDQITSMSYGGALLGGYKADFSSLSVTPLVGIGFSKFENPARKTAEGAITAKAYDTNRVDLIAGLSVAGEIKTASDMVIVPEIHGFAYYNVKDVEKQVTLEMNGLQNNVVSYLSNDTTKTNFTIGASVTAKSGMIEYGASVDGQFADKYSAVLGSLKLKVNL